MLHMLTSFSTPTVGVLFSTSHRHLADVLTPVPFLEGVRAVYKTTRSLNLATPEHQTIDEIMPYAFRFGWNTGHGPTTWYVGHCLSFRFDTLPVPDSAELFTAWFSSDRQTTLRAIRVPQSPLGLGSGWTSASSTCSPPRLSLRPLSCTFVHGIWIRSATYSCGMDAVGRGTS